MQQFKDFISRFNSIQYILVILYIILVVLLNYSSSPYVDVIRSVTAILGLAVFVYYILTYLVKKHGL